MREQAMRHYQTRWCTGISGRWAWQRAVARRRRIQLWPPACRIDVASSLTHPRSRVHARQHSAAAGKQQRAAGSVHNRQAVRSE